MVIEIEARSGRVLKSNLNRTIDIKIGSVDVAEVARCFWGFIATRGKIFVLHSCASITVCGNTLPFQNPFKVSASNRTSFVCYKHRPVSLTITTERAPLITAFIVVFF
jgi:hypothetical protein